MTLKKTLREIVTSENLLKDTAYSYKNNNYSYDFVLIAAEKIRQSIAKRGSSKPVIIFGHKQVGMLAGFIGCNAAGVAFVPVDFSTPKDRIEHIVKLSEAQCIISISPFNHSTECETVDYEQLTSAPSRAMLTLDNYISGESISYIIFTSGSTGVPKGVEISIDALDDFVDWSKTLINDARSYIFLNHALYSFDLSIFEVWTSIAKKGTIVALDHENNFNMRANFEIMKNEKCTICVSTPSFIEICLIDTRFASDNLSSISHFIFCGEILSKTTAIKLKNKFPQAKILNLYGPTEATCATTSIEITDQVLTKYDILPVGFVKPGTEIYLEETENGAELIIVGTNVSHGYINDETKTKAQFFTKNGLRAYRTGDYGFFEKDSLLFVKGRIDRQIKFKGHRIELEEIESVMRSILNISTALCFPIYKDGKVIELVAVIPQSVTIIHAELATSLKETLPDYMIPAKIRTIEQIPLTSNGKIDRKEIEKLLFIKKI